MRPTGRSLKTISCRNKGLNQSPPMPSPIIPILLAGGAGTRLSPGLAMRCPSNSFLWWVTGLPTRNSAARAKSDVRRTHRNHRTKFPFLRRQAEEVGVEATVVIEPMRRDSAAAMAAAKSRRMGSMTTVASTSTSSACLRAKKWKFGPVITMGAANIGFRTRSRVSW